MTTSLGAEDYQEYYNGFANRVLWPILHYRFDLAEFSRRDLSGYMRVNEHFATELDKILRPDDLVWVHDYHLIPLAKALRERGHRNRIGFFLHIPCPPPEVLTALPNHERLIPTLVRLRPGRLPDRRRRLQLLALSDARMRAAQPRLHTSRSAIARCGSMRFRSASRPSTSPRPARRAVKSRFVQNVVGSLNGRPQIIGVDRLDYSKGLNLRLEAYEQFLATYRGLARQGDLPADHAEEPQRNPEYARDGAAGQPGRGPHQRHIRRSGLDADPLRQPRATAAPRSPGFIARRASDW